MCRAFEEVREETKHERAIEIARSVQLPVEEVKALDTKKPA